MQEKEVLRWFARTFDLLQKLASEHASVINSRRILLTQPSQPLQGSIAKRKLDIGIAMGHKTRSAHWSHILVPGELSSSPNHDVDSNTWRNLGRYVRKVFMAQDTRRFVLGFTLCDSIMRLWEFDSVGAIASSSFDLNSDPLQFISAILGFLLMNDEQLGFDPSIISANGERFMNIRRNGRSERFVLDSLLKPASCIAGRATTCWKAHLDDEFKTPIIIKDSWQYPEREEEGKMLQDITNLGIVNVARHFYHTTVTVNGQTDDVRQNVRKNLDVMKASNWGKVHSQASGEANIARLGVTEGSSSAGQKRSPSQTDASLPPSKRSCFSSPVSRNDRSLQNRFHRRVCIRDYGKPIHKASSRVALVNALGYCIEGYETLHTKAGILQGDISIGNLMINEDVDNISWPAFLIDLDLAIKERRNHASGAIGKTGTRAFMAIGLLLGEKHSFWHDLESFFWVVFWICIHYDGPGKNIGPTDFDKWNYLGDRDLPNSKRRIVAISKDFNDVMDQSFTPYYRPLMPCLGQLRRVVFPGGARREKGNWDLYQQIKTFSTEQPKTQWCKV